MDTTVFLSDLYYFCCSCHFCNQNHCLSQNQSHCHFRRPLHQSHLNSYCNIGPYPIRIPQSNSTDYKMNPCRIQVTTIFGKRPLSPRLVYFMGFFFFSQQTASLLLPFIYQVDPYFVNYVDM